MDSKLYFGKVYIIEWLAEGDAKTGRELFDELQPIGIMSRPPVDVEYQRVTTRDEFLDYLRQIQNDFRITKRLPLLHIETHGITVGPEGGPHGIGSSVSDCVLWPELMGELIPLNRLTQLRMTVVLAACEGFWGLKMLQPGERAAFLSLLGPTPPISAGKLAKACMAFYRSIFQGRNGNAALKAMNDTIGSPKPTFVWMNAETAFVAAYRAYLTMYRSPERSAQRVDELVKQVAAKFRAERGVGMWAHEIERVRADVRAKTEAHEEFFNDFRRRYFFIDLFPENDERFPIKYSDCNSGRS